MFIIVKSLRPFQVLCKLKKTDIRFIDSYKGQRPNFGSLPLSALYKEIWVCQINLRELADSMIQISLNAPQKIFQAELVFVPNRGGVLSTFL